MENITLRDFLAAAAYIAFHIDLHKKGGWTQDMLAAREAYKKADCLLKAREESPQQLEAAA